MIDNGRYFQKVPVNGELSGPATVGQYSDSLNTGFLNLETGEVTNPLDSPITHTHDQVFPKWIMDWARKQRKG